MCDGKGWSLDLNPAFDTDRTLLRIHPDGNVLGTQGYISHENNADEAISYTMGKLFAADPEDFKCALEAFPINGRKIIVNSVQAGWINLKPELSPSLGKNRDRALGKLLSAVNSAELRPLRNK